VVPIPRTMSLLTFDLREAFDSVPWVVYYWAYFVFEYFIYGKLISSLVVEPTNYIFYYGTGLLVLILFNTASWAGRSFVEGAHEGRLKYLLSLPIGRNQLFFEQLMLGATVNTVRLIPPLAVIMWLSGTMSPLTFLSTIVVLTLLGIAVIGLMVSLSFVAFRSFDIYSAVVAGLSALLIRFSTIYYPLRFIPQAYSTVAQGNPLTYGTDLLRAVLGFPPSLLLDPYLATAVVMALVVGTLFAGMFTISHAVEGVKSS